MADASFLITIVNNLIKIDANGSILWEREIADINSIAPTSNGYILTSISGPILRYDLNGVKIWENQNLVNQFANSISDGNIISMGDTALTKIDGSGNIIWQKQIPRVYFYLKFSSISQANDGGYFLFVNNSNLLKTDSDGNYST